MRYTSLPALAAIIATTIACADQSPVGPSVSPLAALATSSSVTTTPTSGPWAKIVEGETGPGSLYALYIPANW
ncbi:MAG: hypothetical protein LC776_14115, partial [Acidobacteria bacterium]|nr:hypothetical protein [Acidobacteriota bacterium]